MDACKIFWWGWGKYHDKDNVDDNYQEKKLVCTIMHINIKFGPLQNKRWRQSVGVIGHNIKHVNLNW